MARKMLAFTIALTIAPGVVLATACGDKDGGGSADTGGDGSGGDGGGGDGGGDGGPE